MRSLAEEKKILFVFITIFCYQNCTSKIEEIFMPQGLCLSKLERALWPNNPFSVIEMRSPSRTGLNLSTFQPVCRHFLAMFHSGDALGNLADWWIFYCCNDWPFIIIFSFPSSSSSSFLSDGFRSTLKFLPSSTSSAWTTSFLFWWARTKTARLHLRTTRD